MAGHSHWAGIKHKKALADAKRGKLFSKLAKHIIIAARTGGGDPTANLKLRYAIDKARTQGMPKDNIERAIKKGTGELSGKSYEELVYEGIGPKGVAFVVDALTDNRNRTSTELRKIFEKRGGNLGKSGSVSWNFELKGRIAVEQSAISEDALFEAAIEAGAEDVRAVGDLFEILSAPEEFDAVKRSIEALNLEFKACELSRMPKSTVSVTVVNSARQIFSLIEDLEDHGDVQNVCSNFDIPEEVLDSLAEKS